MILNEIAPNRINKLKNNIIRLFEPMKIQVVFTDHFEQRVISGNVDEQGRDRGSEVTYDELKDLFHRFVQQYQQMLFRKQYINGVIQDEKTLINIPFRVYINPETNTRSIHFFTMMKTEDFRVGPRQLILKLH